MTPDPDFKADYYSTLNVSETVESYNGIEY